MDKSSTVNKSRTIIWKKFYPCKKWSVSDLFPETVSVISKLEVDGRPPTVNEI